MNAVTFTLQPLTRLAGPFAMPPDRAADVGTSKTINAQLLVGVAPPNGTVLNVILEHSMIRDEGAFESTGQVFTVTPTTTVLTLVVTNPNRFLRWRAASQTGTAFPAQFIIECLGRDA